MHANPSGRGRGRGRGVSAQNNLQGTSQRNPGPQRPQMPGSQRHQVLGPQQQVIRSQPQARPIGNVPRGQTSQQLNQSRTSSTSSEVVEQVTTGVSKLTTSTGNESMPLGRGVVRGRREVPYIQAVRPDSSKSSKEGSSGNPVTLVANYFPITSYTNWTLYQYRVDFNPEEDHYILKRGLISAHAAKLNPYIFDGTVIYSSKKYESEKFELVSKRNFDDTIVIITVSFVRALETNDHANIQVFNLLIRNCLRHLNLQLVGRNFYDSGAKIDVSKHRLQIWPGYETTIGLFDCGLMLRAEISAKIMRQDTVFSFLKECMQNNGGGMIKFKQEVIGTIVLTAYNNKTYKIDDVDDQIDARALFSKNDGSKMSYIVYYKEKWNIDIKEPKQLMLISKKKKTFANLDKEELIYLVPELCSLTGLTDNMRNNFHLMKDLALHTQVNPVERLNRYNKFMTRLQTTPKCLDIFDTWNLKLGKGLVELSGRTLIPETIQPNVNCKKTFSGGINADWTNHLRDLPMFTCARANEWFCVHPSNINDYTMRNFISSVQQVANRMGFILPQPNVQQVRDNQVNNYLHVLEDICKRHNPPLIMCVVSSTRADLYIAIKKTLCVARAIPSQVVVAKNVEKNNKSVCTKIAIQMNAKLGGAPWFVSIPAKGMMIVGFDVCHDKRKNKSVGALVATMDDTYTSYYSAVQQHNSGDELSQHMGALIIAAATKYRQKNKTLPKSIVVYRDGVGDGMLGHVQTTEIKRIKALYETTFKQKPLMAYVIVKKRISTRFFTKTNQGYSNPPPGTVIDTVVTDPSMYDFYLVSQNTRNGTVTPTHYNVLEDTLLNWSPDRMQRLTFKLTHMYFNWSGTVRVPAPCQLAHKLAYLAAQVGIPNAGLNELLYYL